MPCIYFVEGVGSAAAERLDHCHQLGLPPYAAYGDASGVEELLKPKLPW